MLDTEIKALLSDINHLYSLIFFIVGGGIIAITSAFLTKKIKEIALNKGIMDVPNERSSHVIPTPRGGGLSIVIIVLIGVLALSLLVDLETPWGWMLMTSGFMVMFVGLLDDIYSLKPMIRLVIHFLAALLIVLWMGSNFEIELKLISLKGPLAYLFVIFFTVWNINAYNFMDGMDGQASSQAVIVSLSAGILSYFNGNIPLAFVYFLIAASCLGFLKLNWQPAQIFMGDLCSGFLGITFAILALWGKMTKAVPLPAFFILMAVFYVDATYTVFRRFLEGENITKTHHDFAFHHALNKGYSHAQVTWGIILINVFWLVPMALLSVKLRSNWSAVVMVVAYIPIFVMAIALKAGIKQPRLEQN